MCMPSGGHGWVRVLEASFASLPSSCGFSESVVVELLVFIPADTVLVELIVSVPVPSIGDVVGSTWI